VKTLFDFLVNAENWPRWAVHNVLAARPRGDGWWLMDTPHEVRAGCESSRTKAWAYWTTNLSTPRKGAGSCQPEWCRLEQRPMMAFTLCYVATHLALDRLDEQQAQAILTYFEEHLEEELC
jgi:hypothetical protein